MEQTQEQVKTNSQKSRDERTEKIKKLYERNLHRYERAKTELYNTIARRVGCGQTTVITTLIELGYIKQRKSKNK